MPQSSQASPGILGITRGDAKTGESQCSKDTTDVGYQVIGFGPFDQT